MASSSHMLYIATEKTYVCKCVYSKCPRKCRVLAFHCTWSRSSSKTYILCCKSNKKIMHSAKCKKKAHWRKSETVFWALPGFTGTPVPPGTTTTEPSGTPLMTVPGVAPGTPSPTPVTPPTRGTHEVSTHEVSKLMPLLSATLQYKHPLYKFVIY